MPVRPNFDLSVYFIADPYVCAGRSVVEIVRQVAAGGATMIQLRHKSDNISFFYEQVKEVAALLKPQGIPLIINDRVDIALAVDADGVHLGQEDLPAAEARKILGPDKIIGVTAFEEKHFKVIDPAIVDYAGIGPFYATQTKPDKKILGTDKFSQLVKISPVSVVGVGGITPGNVGDVIRAGAHGVAMMRAISEAGDPRKATEEFRSAISAARLRKVS